MQVFLDIEWAVDQEPSQVYVDKLAASLEKPNLKDPEKLKAAAVARIHSPAKAGIYSRIVCIVVGWFDANGTKMFDLIADEPEDLLLDWFNRSMEDNGQCKLGTPEFVGFNIRGDLRVLAQRFMAHGIKPACYLPYQHQPWQGRYTDLMWAFDPETYPKLMELCHLFGIEAEDEITGADVQGCWDRGEIDTIGAHCVADVRRTMELAAWMGVVDDR